VDLHGAHIGHQVVLMFDGGDPAKPIVMGVLRDAAGWPLDDQPGTVQVDADGERLVVRARTQLVLRCGRASITLTSAGKVLVEGTYVSSRSTGVNRIKGGSIQLN
jgi:phage baseplate assembly protein gpV